MCVVSMIGDHYNDKWNDKRTWPAPPWEVKPREAKPIYPYSPPDPNRVGQAREVNYSEDIKQLRKEVEEMKELLKKALEYDKRTGQPHCEQEDKMAFLRKVAESVGVDLRDVLDGS